MSNDPIMQYPRVAAALKELKSALEENGELIGDPLKSVFIIALHRKSSEVASSGCQCDGCLALIEATLGKVLEQRRNGTPPTMMPQPEMGMH